MRKVVSCALVVVFVVALVVLVGCAPKPKEPAATGEAPGPIAKAPAGERPAPAAKPAAAALTKDKVKSFMASMEDDEIGKALDAIGDKMGVKPSDEDPEAMKKAFDAAAKDSGLDAAVKKKGFDSAEDWVKTARKVFPGMAYGMAVAMAEAMGVKEGTPEFKKMVEESEFKEAEKAFEKPSAEEQKIISEVFKEVMAEEKRRHEGKGKGN
jgi:hypothetical protein